MPNILLTKDILVASPAEIAEWLAGGSRGMGAGVLSIGFDFNQADASTLFTIPGSLRVLLEDAYWEPTTSFTGGASSAIGVSSNNAAYNTKGDILGGAAGDVAAGLTATPTAPIKRTIGAKIASPGVVLIGGNTLRYDRITSAFTAGVGLAHFRYRLVPPS